MTASNAAAALLCTLVAGQAGAPSTTVSAPRPADLDDAKGALAGDALSLAAPEDALAALGAVLLHDGGPFSPSRASVRGLSGPRLAASFDGLAVDDPAGVHVDAALLPWAFADQVTLESGAGGALGASLGGAVRLGRAAPETPKLRARLLVGDLATARAQGMLTAPLAEGAVTVGADAATTRGDFTFLPAGAAPAPPPSATRDDALVRSNDDHRRASALLSARGRLGELLVDATLFGAGHEGGIPGFALAPTRGLRGEDGLVAGRVGARVPVGGASLGAAVSARGAHRATEGPADPRSAVQSAAADVAVTAARVPLGDGVDADLQGHGATAGARAGDVEHRRVLAGAGLAARARLGPVRLAVRAEGDAPTDTRPLIAGEARIEVGEALAASLGVARAERAPSLEELYAPTGLVLGNPALSPERAHDVEAALAYRPGRVVSARAVAFAGVIDDAIAYVNQNAFEVAPINTGAALRAGLESFVAVEPSSWCAVASTITLLASRVDATGAPLPLAPPWTSRLALRAGEATGASVQAVLRARGPAASNAFGTLVAPAFALVDVVARAPLAPGLWISGALVNALDVRDARDQNQLPLPGRLWLVGLEVVP
ncbi:MAG: TonB-dependent receptor [Deltaproteobacteria bacterium]|nr:TonB-dependent receptor [Deltaproteobacteria bacterium]